ncbi:MAG: hypothetical protein IT330_07910, partial [Anaerolineae bacterium]|nr:hypothetical protein [Anaerolineae bacterium]
MKATAVSTSVVTAPSSPEPASSGGHMSNRILYYEYEYFELEGVPPYPSPYVAVDWRDMFWVDMDDPNRFRWERHYRTREATPHEGLAYYTIHTGYGGLRRRCEIYEGKETCAEEPITTTLDYDHWFQNEIARVGHQALDNSNSPDKIGGYVYKGTQQDGPWGKVYVFQRQIRLSGSDLYRNYPATETLMFDVEMLRRVRWERTVVDEDKTVLHLLLRLVVWKMLDSSEIPSG